VYEDSFCCVIETLGFYVVKNICLVLLLLPLFIFGGVIREVNTLCGEIQSPKC